VTGPLAPGDPLPGLVVDALDPRRMQVLALLLTDPNPIHYDREVVRRLGLGDREVNQGPSNMAIAANLVQQAFPDGRITAIDLRLLGQAFAGDRVLASGSVSGVAAVGASVQIACTVEVRTDAGTVLVRGTVTTTRPAASGE